MSSSASQSDSLDLVLEWYGRVLAHVWVGDTLISAKLASEGLVATALFPPNLLHADELLKAQETARAAHLGVWSAQ